MSLSFDIILKIQLDNESVFDDSIRKLLLEDVKNRGGIDVFGNVQIENVNKLQKNIFLKLNENYSKYIKINEQRNISLEIEGPSFNNEVERGKFLEFWPDVSSFGEMSDGRLIELIELTSVIGKMKIQLIMDDEYLIDQFLKSNKSLPFLINNSTDDLERRNLIKKYRQLITELEMFFSIEYPKLFSNDSNNDDSLNYLKSLTFNHICSSDDFLTMTSVFSQYHSTTIHKDSLCNTNVIVQKFSNNFATVVHTKNNKNKNIFLPFIPINSVKLFMNYSSKFPLDLEFMNQLNLAFIHFLLKQFRTGKQFRHMFIATKINDNSSIDILLESGYIFRLLVKFQKAELIYYDQLKQSMIENESISLSEANEQFQLISFNDYTLNHLKLIIQTTINKLSSYDQIVFTKSVRLMKRFIAIHLCYNDANEFVQVKNDYSKLFTSITVELIALHIYNGSKKIRSIFDFFFHFLQFLSKIKTNSIITLTGEEKSHSKQKLNYLMFEIDEVNEEKVLNISRLISPHSSIVQRMKLICENSVRYLNNSMNETMNIKKIFQTSTTTFKNRLTINSEFNSRFYQCLNDQQLKNIHLKFPQFHFNPIQKFFPVFQFDVIDEFIKVIRESFPSDTYYVGRDQFGGMDIFIEQIKKKDGDDFHKRFNNIQNLGKSILIFK